MSDAFDPRDPLAFGQVRALHSALSSSAPSSWSRRDTDLLLGGFESDDESADPGTASVGPAPLGTLEDLFAFGGDVPLASGTATRADLVAALWAEPMEASGSRQWAVEETIGEARALRAQTRGPLRSRSTRPGERSTYARRGAMLVAAALVIAGLYIVTYARDRASVQAGPAGSVPSSSTQSSAVGSTAGPTSSVAEVSTPSTVVEEPIAVTGIATTTASTAVFADVESSTVGPPVVVFLATSTRLVPVEVTASTTTTAIGSPALGALVATRNQRGTNLVHRSRLSVTTFVTGDGVLTCALGSDFATMTQLEQTLAVGQIVLTVATESRFTTLRFTSADGSSLEVPTAAGVYTSAPVSADDYAGLVDDNGLGLGAGRFF